MIQHFLLSCLADSAILRIAANPGVMKVATFAKGDTPDSKFIEDTTTKHNTASVAVTDAAQRFLYADYYKMKKMQSWSSE